MDEHKAVGNLDRRQKYLNQHLIHKILEVFKTGFEDEADAELRQIGEKISCSEAVQVLENTISEIKNNVPLSF